jgi:hypothetical protein
MGTAEIFLCTLLFPSTTNYVVNKILRSKEKMEEFTAKMIENDSKYITWKSVARLQVDN